jgi:L-threonylcarbamoyladenylate synthase
VVNALSDEVLQAAQALARGELIGLPTETVYGLAADALNPTAVSAIFKAKGRPPNHPLIVHLADASLVPVFASEVPGIRAALDGRLLARAAHLDL